MDTTKQTDANESRVEISIKGMSCGGCARGVGNSLSSLKGVSTADVNFSASKATVTFDPQQINADAIVSAVKGMGYEAKVE